LIRDDGTPVPAGATVELLADDNTPIDSFGIGHEGLLYLSGLRSQNLLRANWPGGMCTARIPFQPEPGSIPYLGQYQCQQSPAREVSR
jgi:outer membrane usher protein